MSYTNGLDKPTDYFNTKLYTGNGSTQSITGVGFQPDWVWIKSRNSASYNHFLFDVVRGATKYVKSDATSAENTLAESLKSFDSDGFTVGTEADVNNNTTTYASWNWLAGGTASSNTDGSITSSVSANTTAGFSIVSYTGNSTSGATVGHGLSQAPKMIIIKARDRGDSWVTGHDSLGWTKFLYLNTTNSVFTLTNRWNDTAPTSSVFTLGDATDCNYTDNFIAYCFAEKKGYSKFGSYTGNGNADGTFVYTGFKPAFVMFKGNNTSNWQLWDNKRDTFNPVEKALHPDASAVASTDQDIDFLSNGFKIRGSVAHINGSGVDFYYMAFAESPFVSSGGIPTTAR